MFLKLFSDTHRNGEYVKGLQGGSRGMFQSTALFAWTHWGYDNSQVILDSFVDIRVQKDGTTSPYSNFIGPVVL